MRHSNVAKKEKHRGARLDLQSGGYLGEEECWMTPPFRPDTPCSKRSGEPRTTLVFGLAARHSLCNRVGRQLYVKWRRTLGVILLSECPGVRPSTDWLTD